jgi:AcrR family transcriptional regulator
MPRPSRRIDQALLASGRALFPRAGCAGLSVRALAEHCGANPAMFHYHFRTKENFLRTLLQQMYEEMYAGLAGAVAEQGPPLERLCGALLSLARFARDHREALGRVWMDALAGEPVAVEFMRANAPRHLGLLLALLDEAERAGELRPLPPLQRFATLVGAVVLPLVFAAGIVRVTLGVSAYRREFVPQVASDAALRERIELALAALKAAPAVEGAP